MAVEIFNNWWTVFLLYAPLGIIGLWRWGVWLFQLIVRQRYRVIPTPATPSPLSLSLVVPVYNEDPDIFLKGLRSWKQNKPKEIIAVIDASDESSISIFKKFQKDFPHSTLIVTDVPGKRPALALGTKKATGDIIALVDSDTIWDDDIKEAILAPFQDEKVGGVATRQAVLDPKTPAERLFDTRFSLRYFHEYPYLMVVGDALTCLSGRTAVYRKEALLPVLDGMLNETFLWKPCISGEDKRLTSLVMKNGWEVRFQQNAVVRTQGMRGLRQFFRQNLRWSRNSWRTDLRLIFSSWTWRREPFFAYHLVDRSLQPFTLLIGPLYFGASLFFQHWLVAGILLTWWLLSRTIKLYPHIRRHPRDLAIVPLFTLAQYHLALLKIYALLSLDFQSWLTRWDKSRLRRGFWELFPSQTATCAVVFGFGFVIFQHVAVTTEILAQKEEEKRIPFTDDPALLDTTAWEKEFWETREKNTFGVYQTRKGDSPAFIKQKFNLSEENLNAILPFRQRNLPLPLGMELRIPVAALENSYTPEIPPVVPPRPLIVTYDPAKDMIHVKGPGNVVRLTDIVQALPPGQDRLVQIAPGEWLLRSRLYIADRTLLVLDGEEVKWLKIGSGTNRYSYIRSQHGSILINNTRVTSWDEDKEDFDTTLEDGRPFVVAYGSGRMDVLHSEIAYLGFSLDAAEHLQDFGGVYGLSWKINNGSFEKNLLTGNIIGNRIHHNYFGVYTYGTTQMIIRDNKVYKNIQYGIDPHDDSNNLLIEKNLVYQNGNHGIIGSKRVKYSIIRNNQSIENSLHGIMLDRDSDFNLVENNYTAGNINGVAITASHHNLIRQNAIIDNHFGVRSSHQSTKNMLAYNSIQHNRKGVFFYDDTDGNIVATNTISENEQGVHLKKTANNILKSTLNSEDNTISLTIDESSRKTNFIQSFQ